MALRDDPQFERERADFFAGRLGKLFPQLKPGLWHVTGPRGYLGIHETGFIEPSTGKHPHTFPQTENSFALHNGCVSLFDLASATEDECAFMSWKWTTFFSHFRPFTVAFDLNRQLLSPNLLPYSASRTPGNTTIAIPWVEAWHRGPIPVAAIQRYLVLPHGRPDGEVWLAPGDPDCETLKAWANEAAMNESKPTRPGARS